MRIIWLNLKTIKFKKFILQYLSNEVLLDASTYEDQTISGRIVQNLIILSPKLTFFELNERKSDLAKSTMSNISQMSTTIKYIIALKGQRLMVLCKTDDSFRTA